MTCICVHKASAKPFTKFHTNEVKKQKNNDNNTVFLDITHSLLFGQINRESHPQTCAIN